MQIKGKSLLSPISLINEAIGSVKRSFSRKNVMNLKHNSNILEKAIVIWRMKLMKLGIR